MMNHLTSIYEKRRAWDNFVSVHISMFYAQRLLDGVLSYLLKDDGVCKIFSMFKMEYEISSCVKLSSALVPRVKNDRSLKPGKSLNLFDLSGIKQDSFQYHCYDIQGAGFFQTPERFY